MVVGDGGRCVLPCFPLVSPLAGEVNDVNEM